MREPRPRSGLLTSIATFFAFLFIHHHVQRVAAHTIPGVYSRVAGRLLALALALAAGNLAQLAPRNTQQTIPHRLRPVKLTHEVNLESGGLSELCAQLGEASVGVVAIFQ